jgi:hypothetical protein
VTTLQRVQPATPLVRLWRCRVELALIAALVAGSHYASKLGGWERPAYWVLVLAGVGALVAFPRGRLVLRPLTVSRVRRQLQDAFVDAQIFARPTRVTGTRVGVRVRVRIGRGHNQDRVVAAAATLKTSLGARNVDVEPDRANGRYVTLTIVDRDPFDVGVLPWPNEHREHLSIWDPIPFGQDANGQRVDVLLANPAQGARSLLIGGETGSGKSVALALVLVTGHRSPDVKRTWLGDGTELDSAHWKDHVHAYVGTNRQAMMLMLTAIVKMMDVRKAELLEEGKVRVMRGDPVDLLVIDELPFYVNAPAQDKLEVTYAKANRELLRDIASRGRKYGVILVMVAQKPDADVVPTFFRDLLTYRLAYRCKTKEAVRTILGNDLVTDGWDTTAVRPDQLGVGVLDAQAALPTWMKGFFTTAGPDGPGSDRKPEPRPRKGLLRSRDGGPVGSPISGSEPAADAPLHASGNAQDARPGS